ncbi:MAG: NifB/NifX family molybdenum-iron cluster-binding protein [Paludibacter sp.]|jgi:predicted Fe-Mo cluster-binding NifX family protein|nr:NifB/NifX family molybdenum-iron cluster-binding protein [Paludibacter sp.]
MKIAVPTKEQNKIDDHFGHCAFYTVFTVNESQITEKGMLPSPQGCGCKSNIAQELAKIGVSIMLAGGIGEGAINKLNASGINVIRNCRGDVDELLKSYLAGELKDGGKNCAAHADHAHTHSCNH